MAITQILQEELLKCHFKVNGILEDMHDLIQERSKIWHKREQDIFIKHPCAVNMQVYDKR